MSNPVPATTPVKRNRVANVDTVRLLRRQRHLVANVLTASFPGSKVDFGYRAAELHAIENELTSRDVPFERRTLEFV